MRARATSLARSRDRAGEHSLGLHRIRPARFGDWTDPSESAGQREPAMAAR